MIRCQDTRSPDEDSRTMHARRGRGDQQCQDERSAERWSVQAGNHGRFFVWYVEPPPKMRFPAPRALLPTNDSDAGCALSGYLRSQAAMLGRVVAANGVDLRRARFQSPFTRLVKMDLLALFSVWTAHERRHLEQLRRVTKTMASALASQASR